MPIRSLGASALAVALLAAGLTVTGATTASAADHPVINEFSADTSPGSDAEYVELFATPGTDLTGHQLLQVEGDATASARGTVVTATPITGTTDASGLLLVDLASNTLQNGTLTLLLATGYDAAQKVVDADLDGVLDPTLTFEVVDSVAIAKGAAGDLVYGPSLGVAYDTLDFAPGGASRIPDGVDTDTTSDWMRNDFNGFGLSGFAGSPVAGEAVNTPGALNQAYEVTPTEPGECAAEATVAIGAVQGAGDASPLVGTTVEVEGIVTADFRAGLGRFAVQEAADDSDGDPSTSDAVYVYGSSFDLAAGDVVHVTGAVSEFEGLTEITAGDVVVCSSDAEVPAPLEVTLPLDSPELHESMLVTLPQSLAILEYFDFARYGEIVLGTDVQMTPTAVADPGSPEAVQIAADNAANRITLDDARSTQNADPAIHPNGEPFTLENSFRGGDLVQNATGILDWSHDLWRIQPTQGADYTAVNLREPAPVIDGSLHIASFNVLNYFTTLTSEDSNARGADTAEEFSRQESKIVAAILELDADVVGLLEIQNDGQAVHALVDAVNAAAGEERYSVIDTGVVGTDAITTAVIYQAATVEPVGDHAILDASVDPAFDTTLNRPAIAQTFRELATGGIVTVAVNHLKSKGSGCEAVGDPEDPNGQGNCNGVRTAAAQALVSWLDGDPTGSGSDQSLIIGDLNSYDHEDPISAITAAGYVDLVREFGGEDAYSYVFDGMRGYLDHSLASPSLAESVVDAAEWHSNADETNLIDYDMSFKQPAQDALFAPDPYRASDHDAVVIGITFSALPEAPAVEPLAGADRFETSAAVSASIFEPGTDAWIASGESFTDALSAGPAAVHEGASLLTTRVTELPAATAAELTRLQPATVTIAGGPAAVSTAVEAQIHELLPQATIRRLAGSDRFETSSIIAAEAFGTATDAFIASGVVFADALSAGGSAAVAGDMPVLLTMPDGLPASTADALTTLGVESAFVIGGRDAISDSVVQAVRETATATRIAGADRYATNALVVQRFGGDDPDAIVVATGQSFPDALTSATLSAAHSAPLVLAIDVCVSLDVRDAIVSIDPKTVFVVGGPDVLSEDAWETTC